MNEPLCKVNDLLFLRFELEDLEAQKEYLGHFGMQLAHETEDTIYYRGTGIQPYCYVAHRGTSNRYLGAAFFPDSAEQLDQLAAGIGADIIDSMEPAGGRCVKLTDPDGLGIEVYQGIELTAAEYLPTPKLNAGFDKTRVNKLQRFGSGADEWVVKDGEWRYELTSKVMRLGHFAFNVADPDSSIAWYQNTLGLLISDNLIGPDGSLIGAFMRTDHGETPVDHHTINLIAVPDAQYAGTFGHGGYELAESVDDLMAGHFHMKTVGKYYHEWGIGRHLLGSQMYDYWRDTAGFTLEHWTDGDLLDASVPPTASQAKDFVMAQYGPPVPATFGLSMPSDQVEDYRTSNPALPDLLKQLE